MLYYSLFYSCTNTEGVDIDISTGIFYCPYTGSYTITWSLYATDTAGNSDVVIFLRKNGQDIDESRHKGSSGQPISVYEKGKIITQYTINTINILGGRTLVLHLDRGYNLDLYCENCSAGITFITFCVSLHYRYCLR
jgi:hypothetical protein